jgi:isocitrate dehydrogenase (NAD+)
MFLAALDAGKRIGVVATNPPAGPAAEAQLRAAAAARGADIQVVHSLADGAFAIGNAGDAATHDRLVVEAAQRIGASVDVICLAQVSMALARAAVQARVSVPVLTGCFLACVARTVLRGFASEASMVQTMGERIYNVVLIPGDGIGPEISEATVAVLDATGVRLAWREALAGEAARQRHGHPLPDETLRAVREARVALKGPLIAPKQTGRVTIRHADGEAVYPSVNNALRRELGVFVNVRPVRRFEGIAAPFPALDLVIMREVTEDTYVGWEQMKGPDEAWAIKRISRKASERLFHYSFEYARRMGRRRVTAGHKANVLNLTDGLFLQCGRDVAQRYPDIEFEDCMVDALCLRLVKQPDTLDVLALPNQYGDILSDLCGGLAGSVGLAPGANIGADISFFEASHGAAPDIAGRGIANPIALILSGAMLLGHLGERDAERRVWHAVQTVLQDGSGKTADLGGRASTHQVTEAIIAALT